MTTDDIFVSTLRPNGDLAGVFEYDGECGYFYLYQTGQVGEAQVLSALQVIGGASSLSEQDVTIRWDSTESWVGLFMGDRLLAVFDGANGRAFSGSQCFGSAPSIPQEVADRFRAGECA